MEEEISFPPIKGKTTTFAYLDFEKAARENLLCKSTCIYGESGEGKSYIANTLLHALSPYVNICYVFCPTARIDREFPMVKYTSPLFVYETLDVAKINAILQKGEDESEMLRAIEDPEKLYATTKEFILEIYRQCGEEALFERAKRMFMQIRKTQKKFESKERTKKERDDFALELVRMYKVLLYECKRFLHKKQLKIPAKYKDLALPVLFFDINPNSIALFNDLGDEIQALNKKERQNIAKLVMKERHYGITTVMILQDVTYLAKTERTQIKVNMFVTSGAIERYISTLGIKGVLKRQFEEAAEFILNADKSKGAKNRKYPVVVYLKLTGAIYYTYADPMLDLEYIGNEGLYEKLEEKEMKSSDNNPLSNIFL